MTDLRERAVSIGVLSTLLVLAGLIAYRLQPGHAPLPAGPYWTIIGLALAGLAAVAALPWRRLARSRAGLLLFVAWSLFDIAMISALVAVSGGGASPLWVLYLLTTVFFAASYPWRAQLLLLALTVAAYASAVGVAGDGLSGARFDLFLSSCTTVWVMAAFLSWQLQREAAGHARAAAALADAQQQLLAQERAAAVADTAASVAHELRNPLAVLSNVVYLLRSRTGPDADEAVRGPLGIAERELATAARAVGNLLEFARPRAPRPAPLDPATLLDDALAGCPPPQSVHVRRVVDGAPPTVLADRDQMLAVLGNLLANAYDAAGERGTVTIGAGAAGGQVRIWVADDGPGIPAGTTEALFAPFTGTKIRGAGLGLTVVSRLVAAHRGQLSIECPAEGGTTVSVLLAAASERASAPVGTGAL